MTAPFDLTGRRILVVGASAGIGRATAVLLASLGAQVVLNGRDGARLELVRAELQAPQRHQVAPFDITDIDGAPAWLKSEVCVQGALDGMVHCAGLQVTLPVRSFSAAHFDKIMHLNLGSALALARGFRQRGCCNPGASIVLISSIGGFLGQPGNVVYGASKAGLMSAARGLAMEFVRDQIRVNAIAPAMVDTQMSRKAFSEMSEPQVEAITRRHPMGIGQPEDIAGPVAFLLSDASRWITGTCITVDGGHMVG
jgi:NAD(P)-dependent dehydrogenase (short-subunit alcohol dehydrogenase family)